MQAIIKNSKLNTKCVVSVTKDRDRIKVMKDNFPKLIPVFPLAGVIYFPKTNLPLNIFEDRYLQLVNDSMGSNKLMGMIQSKRSSNDLYKIGCLGKINNFKKNDDGRILGKVGADRHWSDNRCIEGVFEVTGSEVSGGYGPTLYDVAIEWATMNGLGLVADRNSVSHAAERVWEKYLSARSDVTAHKLPNGYCIGKEAEIGGGGWYNHRYTKEESLIPTLARSGQLEVIYDNEIEDIKFYI